jgi:serine/threonine-protein kinase
VKTCPVCGKEYPDNVKFCPVDGSTLRAKSPSADLVGQVIADRYHIVKKLGEGGMGAVYLGEHVKMGRKSAIKVMSPSMVHDPDAISRFNREAANASRISHPNVCQIYDFGETPDGVIYLAMEFIEGRSLTDLIDHEGALPAPRAARILKQAADALQAAHDLGIVHRDLKPDNIMIMQGRDGADVVKVVDFGIAKAVAGDETGQKVTKTGLVVGTPEYMSPEQLSGDKLDGRSDIYSLGLVLYRMLTGVLPFQADTAQEVMIKRLTDEPTPLAEARPDIVFPAGIQPVVDRALARAAPERYQNAGEFGRDTMATVEGMEMPGTRVDLARASTAATQLMSGDEVVEAATKHVAAKKAAGKKGPPPPPPPPPKKFPMVPVLGGVAGVGALAAVAVLMMNKGPQPQPLASAESLRTNQPAPETTKTNGGGRPPRRQPDPGQRQPPDGRKQDTAVGVSSPPPAVANWADTLDAANRAFDADDNASARRMATAVYTASGPTAALKASAAILVAATWGAENNAERAIDWYRNALRYATGTQRERAEAAIRDLGGTP